MHDWAHSPLHRFSESGTYMVTAGTYNKVHHFATDERLDLLAHALFKYAAEFGWTLHAWAVLANHYHFVATATQRPTTLPRMLSKMHMNTAKAVNGLDRAPGRKVWFQYWDTELTFEKSYLARLNYVHNNPVRHGLVQRAEEYRWCSAAWFSQQADTAFQKTVGSFKIDAVHVPDDF